MIWLPAPCHRPSGRITIWATYYTTSWEPHLADKKCPVFTVTPDYPQAWKVSHEHMNSRGLECYIPPKREWCATWRKKFPLLLVASWPLCRNTSSQVWNGFSSAPDNTSTHPDNSSIWASQPACPNLSSWHLSPVSHLFLLHLPFHWLYPPGGSGPNPEVLLDSSSSLISSPSCFGSPPRSTPSLIRYCCGPYWLPSSHLCSYHSLFSAQGSQSEPLKQKSNLVTLLKTFQQLTPCSSHSSHTSPWPWGLHMCRSLCPLDSIPSGHVTCFFTFSGDLLTGHFNLKMHNPSYLPTHSVCYPHPQLNFSL